MIESRQTPKNDKGDKKNYVMAPATNQKWPKRDIADMIYNLCQSGCVTIKISKKVRKYVFISLTLKNVKKGYQSNNKVIKT